MYEVIAILNPNVTSEFVESKISDWTKIVEEYDAKLHRTDRWGKKNLAYEVKKFHQGYFLLFHISGKSDVISELERRFRIADEVIRYQSVKLSDPELVKSNELLDQMNARVQEDRERREAREARETLEKNKQAGAGEEVTETAEQKSVDSDVKPTETKEASAEVKVEETIVETKTEEIPAEAESNPVEIKQEEEIS